jgi:phosphoesterase RecJ-like protein
MSALSKEAFQQVASWVAPWRRVLLISHEKPDGDALGAMAAARLVMEANGVGVTALLYDALPGQYGVFDRFAPMPVLDRDVARADMDGHDGVIVLDTCTYIQLRPILDWFRLTTLPKLVIDHHVTREDIADQYLIDPSAAATCLIVHDWAQAMGWPMGPDTAEALFIGMATDTGWFRYSNTDARVLLAAADLVARGEHPHELYQRLYLQEKPARVRLLGAALQTLELLLDERLAVMTLSAQAIAGAGATRDDTEDIVNEPMRIGSVIVSVLLVEAGDGNIRMNFRSKPPPPAGEVDGPAALDIDVAKIAENFGGGGHVRAAGARKPGTLPDIRSLVIDHVARALT